MNQKLKRRLIIIGGIVLVAVFALIIQRFIFNNLSVENLEAGVNATNPTIAGSNETENKVENTVEEPELVDDGKALVVPAYSDKITNNSLWCGSFALVWNDLLKVENAKEIKFDPQEKSAENLNKQEFNESSISESGYYKVYGPTTLKMKKTIEKAIKEKFNETSDVLDLVTWYKDEKAAGEAKIFYAMLKKIFTFKYEFEDLDKGNFEGDKYTGIKYFGVKAKTKEAVKDQIRILYYNNDEDFAVELSTKEKERIILCNNPEGESFKQIYENIDKKSKDYTGIRILESGDEFKMPELNIDLLAHFKQFENKTYMDENGDVKGTIDQAMQTIKLKLDKKGGSLKSEAVITTKNAIQTDTKTPRKLYLDDSFVMFLAEEEKDMPYYGSVITDITQFQK